LLTDRDEMSNLNRGTSIDASFQVSVHLEVSEEKNLKNQPFRNKNRLWLPCLLGIRDGMSNLYRGLPIDASCQVSVHLAEGFQRRILKCDVNGRQTTDDGRQVMTKAQIAFGKVS